MDNLNTEPTKLKFSRHAADRKNERDISDSSVNAVLQEGLKISCEGSNIYYDESTKVVCNSHNNLVITVNKNTRNTRFQLSERTLERQKSLQFKADIEHNYHAMCELAEMYLSGELGERDVRKAVELYKRAASKGNSHAMCKLSEIYEAGYLGAPNEEEADKWMRKAADRNNVHASAIIGERLLSKFLEKYPVGSNIFRPSAPKKEIIFYFNKAINKGGTRAMWHLGWIFEKGLLGEKNVAKALEFYVKAAKLGSPNSLKSLQKLTEDCYFSAKELEEILEHIYPNLIRSSIGMAFRLGQEQLLRELGYNPIRGLKMLEQVALKKETNAMIVLAACYQVGRVCKTNLKLAQYWYTKLGELYDDSAKSGNVHSLWKLGDLYLDGTIGDFDLEKAEECFKIAVEKSANPLLMAKLGCMYLKGMLGDKPPEKGIELTARAIRLFESQANQQIADSFSNLSNIYYKINCFKNAMNWLSKTPSECVDSQLLLANIYFNDCYQDSFLLGVEVLKNIILDEEVEPSEAFSDSKALIDEQMVFFLESIAETSSDPVPAKDSSQYAFQKFAVSELAKVYKNGEFREKDYHKASKYLHQLFIDFEDIPAGNQLIWLYIEDHLPEEYYDRMKSWALQIPDVLMSDKIDYRSFMDCIILLGKLYQITDLLGFNAKEAVKWLYLASYVLPEPERIKKDLEKLEPNIEPSLIEKILSAPERVKNDLEKLEPNLEPSLKEEIISELSKMTQTLKVMSPKKYKVCSKILGDICYDKKFINQNIDEAIFWYTESSAKNNSRASLVLGNIYRCEKQDLNTAVEWYMLSAQQGNSEAIEELKIILAKEHSEKLSTFLSKYEHHSLIDKSEWEKCTPFMNLDKYPETSEEQYALGKHYLGSNEKLTKVDARRAAHWFRKSEEDGNIEAAIELYTMYKSGIMGENVSSVADYMYVEILALCCYKLKALSRFSLLENNIPLIMKLLKSVSSLLKSDASLFPFSDVAQTVDHLITQTDNINKEIISNIVSKLNQLRLELCSSNIESTISNAVAELKLTEGSSSFS